MPAFVSGTSTDNPGNVERDRYDRYLMPRYPLDHPLYPGHSGRRELVPDSGMMVPWTRVSTIASVLPATRHLEDWRARLTVKGMGMRPDLFAVAAATPIDDKGRLLDIAKQAQDAAEARAASNLGNALHSFTERIDRGEEGVQIPRPWDEDINAYLDALEAHDLEVLPEYVECRIINPRWADGNAAGVAGMFDNIYRYTGKGGPHTVLQPGDLVIGDKKTGTDPLKYGHTKIAIQEWLYATAWAIFDGTKFVNMPKGLRTDVAIVIHLPAGKAECTVNELSLEGCEDDVKLALDVRAWRRKKMPYRDLSDEERSALPDPDDAPPFTPDDSAKTPARGAAKKAAARKAAPASAPEPVADQRVKAPVMDGTGKKPVAPLAAEGQMGCSVCHRTGHRKGSPKCLGDDDPGVDFWPSDEEIDQMDEHVNSDEQEHPDYQGEDESDPEDPLSEDDEDEPDQVDWSERIEDCTSKAQLQALRRQAKEQGVWTKALLAMMVERLDQIESTRR